MKHYAENTQIRGNSLNVTKFCLQIKRIFTIYMYSSACRSACIMCTISSTPYVIHVKTQVSTSQRLDEFKSFNCTITRKPLLIKSHLISLQGRARKRRQNSKACSLLHSYLFFLAKNVAFLSLLSPCKKRVGSAPRHLCITCKRSISLGFNVLLTPRKRPAQLHRGYLEYATFVHMTQGNLAL